MGLGPYTRASRIGGGFLVALVLVSSGLGMSPASAALGDPDLVGGEQIRERGTVVKASDGDTLDVDIQGDGTSETQVVRLIGIQATETGHGTGEDSCHSREAQQRLAQLAEGEDVVLASVHDTVDEKRDRLIRTMYVDTAGGWVDAAAVMLAEGHGFWFPKAVEPAHNLEYHKLTREAVARGDNLWDTDYCGAGNNQGTNIRMWVQWDADGDDKDNVNGEYAVIKNANRGDVTLNISGWVLRDPALDGFRFPSGTTIPAGGFVKVHAGKGTNSGRNFYWGRSVPIWTNPKDDGTYMGDGAYLFDRDGDMRRWFTYPCYGACGDPLRGVVRMRVQWDAPGNDLDFPNGEYVRVRNRGSSRIDLHGYELVNGGYHYDFPPGTFLKPDEAVTVRMGRGTGSRLRQYWGFAHGMLANGGDLVTLQTFDLIRVACRAWGSETC